MATKKRKYMGHGIKYRVEPIDDNLDQQEYHKNCVYFVIDINHDPFAAIALTAYAEACKATSPIMASDLMDMAQNAKEAKFKEG